MNIKRNILGIFILLLSFSPTFSSESLVQKGAVAKLLGYLASTKAAYIFDKYIQNAIQLYIHRLNVYGDEFASPEYQALGNEIQTKVGVPKEYQVPIKILSPKHPLYKYIGALAETDGIYINKEKFDQYQIVSKFNLLFHEAIHKKYNDLSFFEILIALAFCTSVTCTYTLLKQIGTIYSKPWYIRWGIIFLAGEIASVLTSFKFQRFIERRADIEGCYASECHFCVRNLALARKKLFEEEYTPLKNNGYLFYDELEMIAQELEKEAKICEHHKNN